MAAGRKMVALWQQACLLLLFAAPALAVQDECADKAKCACWDLGGAWVGPPKAPKWTCRFTITHQGRTRYADTFLPEKVTEGEKFPLWTHLHGLHWSKWQNAAGLDHPIRGGEAFYLNEKVLDGSLRDKAIHVYPDSWGDPTKRQFWNSEFWNCAQGHCLDPKTDDIGFLEKLMVKLLKELPVKKDQVYMSGYSNGGMMLQTLLCQSEVVPPMLKAAALVNSGMSKTFLSKSCPAKDGLDIPLIILSGTQDKTFNFNKDEFVLAPRANWYSSVGFARAWFRKRGCSVPPGNTAPQVESGPQYSCHNLCCTKPDSPLMWCPLEGGTHDYSSPRYGLKSYIIWKFFMEQYEKRNARAYECGLRPERSQGNNGSNKPTSNTASNTLHNNRGQQQATGGSRSSTGATHANSQSSGRNGYNNTKHSGSSTSGGSSNASNSGTVNGHGTNNSASSSSSRNNSATESSSSSSSTSSTTTNDSGNCGSSSGSSSAGSSLGTKNGPGGSSSITSSTGSGGGGRNAAGSSSSSSSAKNSSAAQPLPQGPGSSGPAAGLDDTPASSPTVTAAWNTAGLPSFFANLAGATGAVTVRSSSSNSSRGNWRERGNQAAVEGDSTPVAIVDFVPKVLHTIANKGSSSSSFTHPPDQARLSRKIGGRSL